MNTLPSEAVQVSGPLRTLVVRILRLADRAALALSRLIWRELIKRDPEANLF